MDLCRAYELPKCSCGNARALTTGIHRLETSMTEPALAPRISVVICTWNRSRLLRKTLEHMTNLDIAPGTRWELIVVNNNCSDDTETVLDDFQNKLPLVRL